MIAYDMGCKPHQTSITQNDSIKVIHEENLSILFSASEFASCERTQRTATSEKYDIANARESVEKSLE